MLASGDRFMKITIDTKEDNPGEIRKVISLLQNLISGSSNSYTNYGNSPSGANADTSNLMSMFGDASSAPAKGAEAPDTPPDFSGFLNLVNNKNPEKKEPVEIEESGKIEFF